MCLKFISDDFLFRRGRPRRLELQTAVTLPLHPKFFFSIRFTQAIFRSRRRRRLRGLSCDQEKLAARPSLAETKLIGRITVLHGGISSFVVGECSRVVPVERERRMNGGNSATYFWRLWWFSRNFFRSISVRMGTTSSGYEMENCLWGGGGAGARRRGRWRGRGRWQGGRPRNGKFISPSINLNLKFGLWLGR